MTWFFTDRIIGTNKEEISKRVGDKKLIFMNQIHSNIVKIVDKNSEAVIKECDGLVSSDANVALCVVVADCNPVLFYDEQKQVVGVAHAGRMGTYGAIVLKVIEVMQESFTCKAQDIKVFIGPSIRECCYEVGAEVICGFEKFTCKKDERIYLDLLTLNLSQLKSVGIQEENIQIHPSCTCCDENYFSYRREATKERFCGVVCL